MTLPTPDAHSTRVVSDHHQSKTSPTHSIPTTPPLSSDSSLAASQELSSPLNRSDTSVSGESDHALNFATHSWDLATGGLKTLTAKRELPLRARSSKHTPDMVATSRSSMFMLVILICIVLMLIGGGIVLLVMLQP